MTAKSFKLLRETLRADPERAARVAAIKRDLLAAQPPAQREGADDGRQ